MGKMEQYLRECGLTDEQVTKTLAGIEQECGRFGTRTVCENILVDPVTGKVRVTRAVEGEYRKLFARAGMRMDAYLGNRRKFLEAFRYASNLEFARLNQADPWFPTKN